MTGAPGRLVARLVADGHIAPDYVPDGATFHRTYAGRVQREAGAWSWYIVAGSREVLAGFVPVTELLRAPALVTSRESGVVRGVGALVVDPG